MKKIAIFITAPCNESIDSIILAFTKKNLRIDEHAVYDSPHKFVSRVTGFVILPTNPNKFFTPLEIRNMITNTKIKFDSIIMRSESWPSYSITTGNIASQTTNPIISFMDDGSIKV